MKQKQKTFISLLALLLMVFINHLIFKFMSNITWFPFKEETYFSWFVEEGSLISLLTAIVGAIWNGLDKNQLLISSNPRMFISGICYVFSVVWSAIAVALFSITRGKSVITPKVSGLRIVWDSLSSIFLLFVFLIICFLWAWFAAPMMYFIFLIAAAPVRLNLINPKMHAFIDFESAKVEISEKNNQESSSEHPNGISPCPSVVSLTEKPFIVASLFASLLLGLIKIWIK